MGIFVACSYPQWQCSMSLIYRKLILGGVFFCAKLNVRWSMCPCNLLLIKVHLFNEAKNLELTVKHLLSKFSFFKSPIPIISFQCIPKLYGFRKSGNCRSVSRYKYYSHIKGSTTQVWFFLGEALTSDLVIFHDFLLIMKRPNHILNHFVLSCDGCGMWVPYHWRHKR